MQKFHDIGWGCKRLLENQREGLVGINLTKCDRGASSVEIPVGFGDFRSKQNRANSVICLQPLSLESGNQGEIKTHGILPPPKEGGGWDSVNQCIISTVFYIVMLEASCVNGCFSLYVCLVLTPLCVQCAACFQLEVIICKY